ncbi:MAG: zinc finger-like domain-containing protein [Planctomycetes bacterium]|nr:zinc finger-like domain-containing protein [Planctomycetota bacterium]
MRKTWGWLLGLLVITGIGAIAQADVVELVGGRAVQGRILSGQTSEEALALELYDTGGTILVKWDHIVPARAKELRVQTGIEVSEDEAPTVAGHRVLLVTGQVLEGLVLNPDAKDGPVQLKTRTSVQNIDRSQWVRTDPTELDGLLVYKPEEWYQIRRDQSPPDTPFAHKLMALFCMKIGALSQASTHLEAAMADGPFSETPEGKVLPALKKQLDVLMKSQGAQDLVAQINAAMRSNRWNLALSTLNQLDAQYKDEQVRKLVHFELLESRVVRGRDGYFGKEVQRRVYATMGRLIEGKSREKKPLRADENAPRGVATPGTLAAARQWLARDLPTQLWEKVAAELELKPEEMDRYWKARSGKNYQSSSYGTGSFIVIKRAAAAGGSDPNRQRRPAGSTRDSGGQQGGPQRQSKEDKPKTEEEWWDERSPGDRARWLTAFFGESSGIFEVIRADESESCDSCGGRGVLVSNGTDGSTQSTVCPKCNGSTKFRKVVFK